MLKKFLVILFVAVVVSMFVAAVTEATPYKFKERDIEEAEKVCEGAPCPPELVPTEDDEGNINVALLEDAEPNADSCLPGYALHQIEHLNDGFYNNCRSWITGVPPDNNPWAEVDLGDVYLVKKVVIGSDHCGHYADRAATKFDILGATEYNADSDAGTWKKVYSYDDASNPISTTVPFEFAAVDARYVRVVIPGCNTGNEVRIDEIEIYGTALTETAVYSQGKLTTTWGRIKSAY